MKSMDDFYIGRDAKTTVWDGDIQICPHPWRRFFARTTDRTVFSLVTVLIYIVFLGRSPVLAAGRSETVFLAVSAVITIICESIMLSLTGTTPGKWLFGISLRTGYGRKLSFKNALIRNFRRFIFAEGLMLPIISWIAMSKAYNTCKRGSVMDYDDYIIYKFRKRPLAIGIMGTVISEAAVFALGILLTVCFMTVPHKGDITTAQFIENYNHLVDYTYTGDVNRKLDNTMRFDTDSSMGKPYENNSVNFQRIGKGQILDGIKLTIRGFNYSYRNFYDFGNEMMFITMSFADSSFKDRVDMLINNGFGLGLDGDVSFEFADTKVEYNIETDNFRMAPGHNINSKIKDKHMFMPIDEESKSTLEISFTVNKIK